MATLSATSDMPLCCCCRAACIKWRGTAVGEAHKTAWWGRRLPPCAGGRRKEPWQRRVSDLRCLLAHLQVLLPIRSTTPPDEGTCVSVDRDLARYSRLASTGGGCAAGMMIKTISSAAGKARPHSSQAAPFFSGFRDPLSATRLVCLIAPFDRLCGWLGSFSLLLGVLGAYSIMASVAAAAPTANGLRLQRSVQAARISRAASIHSAPVQWHRRWRQAAAGSGSSDEEASSSSSGERLGLIIECDGALVDAHVEGHRVAFNRAFEASGWGGGRCHCPPPLRSR